MALKVWLGPRRDFLLAGIWRFLLFRCSLYLDAGVLDELRELGVIGLDGVGKSLRRADYHLEALARVLFAHRRLLQSLRQRSIDLADDGLRSALHDQQPPPVIEHISRQPGLD